MCECLQAHMLDYPEMSLFRTDFRKFYTVCHNADKDKTHNSCLFSDDQCIDCAYLDRSTGIWEE